MPSDYIEEYIVLGFYAENQKVGTDKQRTKFSNTLFADYDEEIRERGKEAGVAVTKESRSLMAVLARMSPGNDTATQAGNGVAAYRKFLGV